jgi:ankyrin repeat protein
MNTAVDADKLDDMPAELRAQDIQAGRVQEGSSSSSYHDDALPGTPEEAFDVVVDESPTEVDRWLLERGLSNVDEANSDGRTALWTAAQQGDMKTVSWLVTAGKADVNHASKDGETPLYIAA